MSKRISENISKPLTVLGEFMRRAGSTGDISHSKEEAEILHKYSQAKDEIAGIITDIDHFMEHISHISDELESLADGDLTTDIEVVSDVDIMGRSVKHLADNLNKIFSELNASSAQVSVGARQIAEAAQDLAENSTQQAYSVEQLTTSIAEIADKTKVNVATANKAADHATLIKGKAEKGSKQMDDMIAAVHDINDASQSISEVIKTINDIAFQTNLLALNAAIEAARAGEQGKGFAVVAEEVRKLAAKSAEAANATGSLIQNSIDKAELGNQIAKETSEGLVEIVEAINESSGFIQDIANLSSEQSEGIIQINTEVEQVHDAVQNNSATAQESAASSEQMSAQANILEEMIAEFKLRGDLEHVRSEM
jgi:methyl-accepting chemotaxis protein